MIDWLIFYIVYSKLENILIIWRHLIIACEGMQNVGTCFAPTAIKSREVTLLCHICFNMGPSFLRSHSMNGLSLVSLYYNQGILRTYSNPDPDQMFSLLTCTIILYMYANVVKSKNGWPWISMAEYLIDMWCYWQLWCCCFVDNSHP